MISREEIVDWLLRWQDQINARDYVGARAMFAEDVAAFGTFADRLQGLDALVEQQWREIWPVTSGFRFDLASLSTSAQAEGELAFAAVLWSSTGLLEGALTYPRRGRATIVLERAADGVLRAVHTHLSMSRDYVARAQ